MENRTPRIAVIGAGWAGAVAALQLAQAGLPPVVFEASAIAGGRARRIEHAGRCFDNGQHLLIGAYQHCLAWIDRLAGAESYQRLPLRIEPAPGLDHVLSVRAAANLPTPWHLLHALVTASPMGILERLRGIKACHALLRRAPAPTATVAEELRAMPAALRKGLFEPLCIGALNTPPTEASARVFHTVVQRALVAHARDCDFIIPRVDLSALLPEPALARVQALGGELRLACPVIGIERQADGRFKLQHRHGEAVFDRLLLAVAPQHLPRLLRDQPEVAALALRLDELAYQAIATVHLEFSYGLDDANDAVRLLDSQPAQWLFTQRTQQGGLRASLVISAVDAATLALNQSELAERCLQQLARSFRLPRPHWQQVLIEKRATWSCTPAQQACLSSLPHALADGHIQLAGDWCMPEFPATLEAAVITGERAAKAVLESLS